MTLSIHVAGKLSSQATSGEATSSEGKLAEFREACRRFAADNDWAAEPVERGVRLFPQIAPSSQSPADPLTFAFDAAGALEPWSMPIADAETHVRVVALWRKLSPLLSDMTLTDESGYWISSDRAALDRLLEGGPPATAEATTEPAIPVAIEAATDLDAEAFARLVTRGDAGDVAAQTQLADCYARGDGAAEDQIEAIRWLRRAALQGGMEAQYELGLRYAEGRGVTLDGGKALQWLRRSAGQENADAQNVLGEIHVESNGPRAVDWFRRAASKSHPAAIYNLGACHYNGFGVKQDLAEAFRLFQQSAGLKYAPAVDMLGECYQRGAGVTADESRAIDYFRDAAEHRCSRAQVSLGACYEFGEGVLKDQREAVRWYRAAAEQNDPQGRYCLASCLESGSGIDANPLEAEAEYAAAAQYGHGSALARWAYLELRRRREKNDEAFTAEILQRYTQAARDDDPFAIIQLGLFHEYWRPQSEPALAAACYERAARLNDPRGQFLWGQCLWRGWTDSAKGLIGQDLTEALGWWRRAADQGEAHADAALAYAAFLGRGAEKDLRESKRRLRACEDLFVWPDAAPEAIFDVYPAPSKKTGGKKPPPAPSPGAASGPPHETLGALLAERAVHNEPWAMHDLALCYDAAHGVADDPALALHWFQQAAKHGLPEAQVQLAQHLLVETEAERSAWLEKASKQEYAPAITLLGERLLAGRGGPPDERRALALFLEAAEQGYPPAMASAGHCFDGGFGTPVDRVRALYWYYRAMSQEYSEVASAIRRLERNQNGTIIA